jgi:hypothetical protein
MYKTGAFVLEDKSWQISPRAFYKHPLGERAGANFVLHLVATLVKGKYQCLPDCLYDVISKKCLTFFQEISKRQKRCCFDDSLACVLGYFSDRSNREYCSIPMEWALREEFVTKEGACRRLILF